QANDSFNGDEKQRSANQGHRQERHSHAVKPLSWLVIAVQQHRKHSEAEWQRYKQPPSVSAEDQGSHEHESETQNGGDGKGKRGAANFAVRDEAVDSMRPRPRRSLGFVRTLLRRQGAKKQKKQQINERYKEKDHKPNRLACVAQPFQGH